MKILVISDTHMNLRHVRTILQGLHEKVDMILHLGDHSLDAVQIQEAYPDIPVHYVRGNCDMNSSHPREKIIEVQNLKIMLTHGDQYDVKYTYDRIAYAAEEKQVNIVLFGHTHIPTIFYHGEILVMNPGSISIPRQGRIPTYGLIEITEDNKVFPAIIQCSK